MRVPSKAVTGSPPDVLIRTAACRARVRIGSRLLTVNVMMAAPGSCTRGAAGVRLTPWYSTSSTPIEPGTGKLVKRDCAPGVVMFTTFIACAPLNSRGSPSGCRPITSR